MHGNVCLFRRIVSFSGIIVSMIGNEVENTVDKSIDESGSLRASVSQESLVSTLSGTPETGSYGYQVALRREKRSGVLRTLVGYRRVNVTSRQLWLFGDTLGTCYMCRA
ncbi:hypothetical protein HZH66_003527 [Vespula vulgaris]|uniref:Uncharacterized protein n=1 Tax=Vespula vulgaris TaxID=7454 RepID=A0A834KF63_VESVU|nr:hypothetical protein HZH66_003527 [Vespula vulgaris]